MAVPLALLKRFKDSLMANPGLGLLALGLSIGLWLLITIEQNPLRNDMLTDPIPVSAVNVPEGLAIMGQISSVKVRVIAPLSVWEGLRASDFRATVDLSNAIQGETDAAVRVESGDSRVRVVEVSPSKVTVRLEFTARKEVSIRVDLKDTLPFGYEYESPKVSPEKAVVQGPQPLVAQVDAVVADVSLAGAKLDIKHSFKLVPRTRDGYPVEGVSLDPATATVEIPIKQQLIYRAVVVLPQLEGTVAPGYRVSSISVEPVALAVAGSREVMQSIDYLQTQVIDLDNASNDIVRSVGVELPEGASLVGAKTVVVRITVEGIS